MREPQCRLGIVFEVPKVDDSGGGVWNHGQVVGE